MRTTRVLNKYEDSKHITFEFLEKFINNFNYYFGFYFSTFFEDLLCKYAKIFCFTTYSKGVCGSLLC